MKLKTIHLAALAALSLASTLSFADAPQAPQASHEEHAAHAFGHHSFEDRDAKRLGAMKERFEAIQAQHQAIEKKADACMDQAKTVKAARACMKAERADAHEMHEKMRQAAMGQHRVERDAQAHAEKPAAPSGK